MPRKKSAASATRPENYHQLHVLNKAKPKLRTALLKNSDNDFIDAVSECCKNFLRSKTVSAGSLPKLEPHKAVIRKLADKKISPIKRRKLIIQKGGFLQYLLPIVLSTLATILNK